MLRRPHLLLAQERKAQEKKYNCAPAKHRLRGAFAYMSDLYKEKIIHIRQVPTKSPSPLSISEMRGIEQRKSRRFMGENRASGKASKQYEASQRHLH